MTTTKSAETVQVYECDGCGACCRSLIVEAYAIDVLREPRIEKELPVKRGKSHELPILEACWMMYDSKTHACPFLNGENRCDIYATRPNVCVGFSAGSEQCQETRERCGFPPLQPVERPLTTATEIAREMVTAEWEDE